MCGIAGFLSYNKSLHQQQLSVMTDAIAHRGPDAAEFFIKEKRRIFALAQFIKWKQNYGG